MVQPSVKLTVKPAKTKFDVLFKTTEEAQSFMTKFSGMPGIKMSAEGIVRVQHPETFDLASIAVSAAGKFGLQHMVQQPKTGASRVKSSSGALIRFSGQAGTKNVGLCCQMVAKYVAPLKIRIMERHEQRLLMELHINDVLRQSAKQLNVYLEVRADRQKSIVYGVTVYGPQLYQGQMMAVIGELSDKYQYLYKFIELDALGTALFQRNSAGMAALQGLTDGDEASSVSVAFLRNLGGIEIMGHSLDAATKKAVSIVEKRTRDLVVELSGNRDSFSASDQTCVVCRSATGQGLAICGHSCCRNCRYALCHGLVQDPRAMADGLTCPRCTEVISVRDLRDRVPPKLLEQACMASAREFLRTTPGHPLAMCPSKGCMSMLHKLPSYQLCSDCGHHVCVVCCELDNPLHENRNCKDFRVEVKRSKSAQLSLQSLFDGAKALLATGWCPKLEAKGAPRVDENPGLVDGCPAFLRFCEGLRHKRINGRLPEIFYAWHGTGEPSIVPICNEGFDPKRRSGQAYGRGEYFGQNAEASLGYVRGSARLIIAALLKVPETSTHGTFCYVVDSPISWNHAFACPVLVVTYEPTLGPPNFVRNGFLKSSPPPDLFFDPSKIESESEDESGTDVSSVWGKVKAEAKTINLAADLARRDWTAPFRWHWFADGDKPVPYTDTVNSLIEEAYSQYQQRSGPAILRTPPIIRFVDDRPQVYIVDFNKLLQINEATTFTRKIQREIVPTRGTGGACWEYMDGAHWFPYENLIQGKIEGAYRAYVDARGPAVVIVNFPGRPEDYELRLSEGIQVNRTSGMSRTMRRTLSQVPAENITFRLSNLSAEQARALPALLDTIKEELCRIVLRAQALESSSSDEAGSRLPDLSFSPRTKEITLTLRGPSRTLFNILGGHLQRRLSGQVTGTPVIVRSNGDSAQQAVRNPRLMNLLTGIAPAVSSTASRSEFEAWFAHFLIWKAKCSLYGGFVRDWVINGEEANDVDCLLPSDDLTGELVASIKNILVPAAAQLGAELSRQYSKGVAHTLRFSGPWGTKGIEIDFVHPSIAPTPPGVDCCAGNLCIRPGGELGLKRPKMGDVVPLHACIQHCEQKCFVFFYTASLNTDPSCAVRLTKYLDRGWTCISPLPTDCLMKLTPNQRALCKPDSRYK